uniref:Uncharacterized protein n=1 Tax=Timema poppense TaxID=170557 RepID=A0A7R9H635_TIMPO|nr:unnamed protein product [Timema poppensis]
MWRSQHVYDQELVLVDQVPGLRRPRLLRRNDPAIYILYFVALRLVIYGGIHDGPVTSITTSPFIENLILSIGGRIIAIWNNNVQDGPIFWKKSKFTLTSCSWSKSQPSHFYVSCSNGSIEVWDLLLRSDKPYFVQDVSGKIITGLYPQKVDNINNILGVADYNGSFQAYLTPAYTALETEKQVSRTVRLVNKQTEHLRMLVIWHNEWRESHSEYLILKKQMINEELRKREVVVKAKKRQILERKKLEEENQRLRRSKVSLLSKEAHSTQRWLVSQENYMKQIIIGKKNLCREELLQKQEPLITLKRQEEEKKQKEQQILAEKSSLVEKLTADLLPVIKNNEKYYTTTDERVTLKDFQEDEILKQFKKYENIGLEFVNSNRFEYNIDWIALLLNGLIAWLVYRTLNLDPEESLHKRL